ncbi:MAG: hypothetical protein H7A21_16540 [Spirochaetales bacterium]|nr:hypothetical protein [Spirochaetales bacterium]
MDLPCHYRRWMPILMCSVAVTLACTTEPAEEEIDPLALLLLGASRSGSSNAITCGDTTATSSGSLTGTARNGTLSSGTEDGYSFFGSAGGKYLVVLYGLSGGFDGEIFFCSNPSGSGTRYNNNGAGSAEGFSLTVFSSGTTYAVVSGVGSSAGSYEIDTTSTFQTPSGSGRCTGFDGTLANECMDYDTDFDNPATHCANIGGTYNAAACSSTSRQGTCKTYQGSGTGQGLVSYRGYTGDYASDTAMQNDCTALFGSFYVYDSF